MIKILLGLVLLAALTEATDPDGYDCYHGWCQIDLDEQGYEWDYYGPKYSISDCDECAALCDADSNCGAMVCGNLCQWYRVDNYCSSEADLQGQYGDCCQTCFKQSDSDHDIPTESPVEIEILDSFKLESKNPYGDYPVLYKVTPQKGFWNTAYGGDELYNKFLTTCQSVGLLPAGSGDSVGQWKCDPGENCVAMPKAWEYYSFCTEVHEVTGWVDIICIQGDGSGNTGFSAFSEGDTYAKSPDSNTYYSAICAWNWDFHVGPESVSPYGGYLVWIPEFLGGIPVPDECIETCSRDNAGHTDCFLTKLPDECCTPVSEGGYYPDAMNSIFTWPTLETYASNDQPCLHLPGFGDFSYLGACSPTADLIFGEDCPGSTGAEQCFCEFQGTAQAPGCYRAIDFVDEAFGTPAKVLLQFDGCGATPAEEDLCIPTTATAMCPFDSDCSSVDETVVSRVVEKAGKECLVCDCINKSEECSSLTSAKSCNQAGFCKWKSSKDKCVVVKTQCKDYGGKKGCKNAGCYWNKNTEKCKDEKECSDVLYSNGCYDMEGCQWYSPTSVCLDQ